MRTASKKRNYFLLHRFLKNGREKFLLSFSLFSLLSTPLWAATHLDGYFEGEYVKEKSQRPLMWNMWNPKNRLELKFRSQPYREAETYLSIAAESNQNAQKFLLNQGHLKFHRPQFEVHYFLREEHHWVDSPLLKLVNADRVKDDSYGAKAEGMRLDFWNVRRFSGVGLLSKYKTWDGEAYIGKLYRHLAKGSGLGCIYLKKDWRGIPKESYNEVFSLEGTFKLRGIDITGEVAKSTHIMQASGRYNLAWEAELREIGWGPLRTAFSYFDYGRDFRDELSNKFNLNNDHEFDRRGFYGELVYLFPYRAITFTYKHRSYKTAYKHPVFLDSPFYVNYNYAELYLEFINGMTAKTFYEGTREREDNWRHLFLEIVAENRIARCKLQYKIKDLGINTKGREIEYSIGQRCLYGAEVRINLTSGWQFYSRAVFGDGVSREWGSLFSQLAYHGFGNTEIFLDYGNPDHTVDDLVNDSDVADNQYCQTLDRVKLLVKLNF